MYRIRSVMFAALFLLDLAHANTSSALDFSPPRVYPVGTNPSGVLAGDFNGDGKLDIAVANSGSGSISILLGNGDGTFQAAINFDAIGAQPTSLVVGDFNNDGKLDLAVSSSSSTSLFLGNGDGTFRTAIPVADAGGRLFAVDVNLDGKLDLIVGTSMLLGNGDGTFQAARDLGVLPTFAGDLSGDHKPDFAALGPNGISILFGNGDGTFQTSVLQAPAGTTYSGGLLAGDFNGDGNIDIAVQGSRTGCIVLCITIHLLDHYLGLGGGQFSMPGSLAFIGSGGLVGDFNGDGKSDVLFPVANLGYCPCPNGMVLLGPVFNHLPLQLTGDLTQGQGVAADFNGDGLPDLAFTDNFSAALVIFLNTSPTSGADLSIIAVGATPQPAVVGLNLTYAVNILNEGPENATGVMFTDTLPNGVSFVSALSGQGSCIQSQGIITCNIGALPSGVAADATMVVTPTASGTITSTMNVSASEADLALANNSATQNTTVLSVFALRVAKAGVGTGTVTSSPGGIDCGGACSQSFTSGTSVMLAAIPSANSIFGEWSGACTGTDPNVCTVILNSTQSVTATFNPAPDFSVSPAAMSLSLQRGAQISDALAFAGRGGFSGTIALACSMSGPLPMPTCGIAPASVTPGNNAALTIDARVLAAGLRPPNEFEAVGGLLTTWLPLGLFGFVLTTGFDKKRRRMWALCLLVMVVTMVLAACGGGSSVTPPPAAQTYTVTVTATSGAIQHSTPISVTVQ